MLIIGVDYHPSDQYIALVDTETGEYGERQLNHREGEAEKFYRELAERKLSVRVGMEATGYSRSLAPKHLSEAIHYRTLDRTYWA